MSDPITLEDLARISFLSEVPVADRRGLLPLFSRRRLQAGEALVRFGDPASHVYVLMTGELHVALESAAGRQVLYRDFRIGDTIGDFSAIDGQPRSANVCASIESTVVSIAAADFRRLAFAHPQVAETEMRYLVRLLRQMTQRIYDLSAHAAGDRLKLELLRCSERMPGQAHAGQIVSLPTQAELASRTGSHREAVSRYMTQLERDGLIERKGGSLFIPDLRRLATGDPVSDTPLVGLGEP